MLLVDIVSVFPFSLITSQESGNKPNIFIRFLRMARLSKIIRARTIASTLKFLTSSDALEAFLKTHQGVSRLFGGLIIIGILAHFIACIWCYSAKLDGYTPDT